MKTNDKESGKPRAQGGAPGTEESPQAKATVKNGPGGAAGHTPIIITGDDGSSLVSKAKSESAAPALTNNSAAINFDEEEYSSLSGATHNSAGLHLKLIKNKSSLGSHVCHLLAKGEECLVIVKCRRQGHQDSDFTIRGGRVKPPTLSPSVSFDHTEYPKDVAAPAREQHSNGNRKIEQLLIHRVVGGVPEADPIHDCPLVPPNGKCKITIEDPHDQNDPI
jgi:hypothetical protein